MIFSKIGNFLKRKVQENCDSLKDVHLVNGHIISGGVDYHYSCRRSPEIIRGKDGYIYFWDSPFGMYKRL